MDKIELFETTPAEKFWDMHFLGNGRLGICVKGEPYFETIAINDDTLWSGSEHFTSNPQHFEAMKTVQQLIREGKLQQANDLLEEKMSGRWSEGYLPMATLYLVTGMESDVRNSVVKRQIESEGIQSYSRQLDLDTAVETVLWEKEGVTFKREYFVSKVQDEIYIRCSIQNSFDTNCTDSHKKSLALAVSLGSDLRSECQSIGNELFLTGRAPDHTEPEYTPIRPQYRYATEAQSNALRFVCGVRIAQTDGEVNCDGNRIYVKDANFVVIAASGKTNYTGFQKKRDNDPTKLLEEYQAQIARKVLAWNEQTDTYNTYKNEHILEYQSLYRRVSFDLKSEEIDENRSDKKTKKSLSERLRENTDGGNDPKLAVLLLQYARYLLISGSRPGSQAMNLQGIWNDRIDPPWASNYTTNINLEMNYWPCEILALPECHQPLFDLIERLSDSGKKTAKAYYHLDGWVVHHNTDFWCNTEPSCENARWSWWPMGAAWLCSHIRQHYEFTGDLNLVERLYPAMCGAVEFYLGFLTQDGEGNLVTSPSVSQENAILLENKVQVAVTQGCTLDMALLRDLFDDYVYFSKLLGKQNAQVEKALEARKRLLPYRIGRFGQLQEWNEDFSEVSPGNPHTSHLYGVYPSNQIMAETTPELAEAAKKSLYRRLLHMKQQNGWGASWKMALAARMKEPFICGLMIKQLCGCLGAGLLTKEGQQIDAILGAGAAIGEMLLQSHRGYIELLPALLVDWQEGHFNGLRARGGFWVSARWSQGKLTQLLIHSQNGGICRIKVGKEVKAIFRDSKQEYGQYSQGILSFQTQAKQDYWIQF